MKIALVGDAHLTDILPKERTDLDYLGTLLNKIRIVYENNDVVIFLGDLFDKPIISYSSLNRISSFFMEFRDKKTYSLIGNHDVPNMNSGLLYRTALGHMDTIGLINVVDKTFKVSGVSFDVISLKASVRVPKERSGDILLGHCFFANEFDPEFSLSIGEIESTGYKHIFLGHDHSPYPEVKVGGTLLHRNGSICRNTGHSYNLRDIEGRVGYVQMLVENGEIVSFKRITVPHKTAKEVFSPDLFLPTSSKIENKFSLLGNVDILLKRFQAESLSSSRATILSVMTEMKTPHKIISYIRDKYASLNMDLK